MAHSESSLDNVWGLRVDPLSYYYISGQTANVWGVKTGSGSLIYKCNKYPERFFYREIEWSSYYV